LAVRCDVQECNLTVKRGFVFSRIAHVSQNKQRSVRQIALDRLVFLLNMKCIHHRPSHATDADRIICKTELTVVMGRSRDWDELQFSWIEWRRLTGQKMRDLFEQVVDLSNQAAQLNRKSVWQ
jgi:peptidyl-dipeptidase A